MSEGRSSGGRDSGFRESTRSSGGRESGRESAAQRRSSRSRGRKRKPRKEGSSSQNGMRDGKQRDAKPSGGSSRGCFFACFGARRSSSPSATESPLFTPLPPPPASPADSTSFGKSSLTQTPSRIHLGSRTSPGGTDNIYSYPPLSILHRRNGDSSEPEFNIKSSPTHHSPPSTELPEQGNHRIRPPAPIPVERRMADISPFSIESSLSSPADLPPLPRGGQPTRRRRRSTAEYSNTSTAAAHLLLDHHGASARSPGSSLASSTSVPLKVGLGQHRLARRVSATNLVTKHEEQEAESERPSQSSLTRHSPRRSSASGHISIVRFSRTSSGERWPVAATGNDPLHRRSCTR